MKVKVRPFRSGGWECDIHVVTPEGKKIRHRIKSPVSSKSGSQRWGEERARHLALGGSVKQSEPPKEVKHVPTLAEFAPEFLEHCATTNKATEMRSKRKALDIHILPALGGLRLDAVDERVIDRFTAALLRTPKQRVAKAETLSAKYICNILGVLSRLLHVAKRWKLLAEVPDIELPRVGPQPFRFLDFDQAERFLVAAREHGISYVWMLVAVRTGLRLGEQRAMQWRHVDLDRAVLRVERGFTEEGGFASPKSGKARDVPLAWDVVAELRELAGGERDPDALVFPSDDGGVLSRSTVVSWVTKLCGLAKVPDVSPHDLRHTFASHAVMHGIPLVQVQQWLGHSKIEQTMKYAHLAPDFGASVVDRLAPRRGPMVVSLTPRELGDVAETPPLRVVKSTES